MSWTPALLGRGGGWWGARGVWGGGGGVGEKSVSVELGRGACAVRLC